MTHFSDCTGNGSEPCWDCAGQGFTSVATEDDPCGDFEEMCETCSGSGYVRCPGCDEQDASQTGSEDT